MQPNEQGWLWSQQLQLFLGLQEGQLHFLTPEGELVLTPEEAAQNEQQRRQAAEDLLAQYRARFADLSD